jgi:hypothetical protein
MTSTARPFAWHLAIVARDRLAIRAPFEVSSLLLPVRVPVGAVAAFEMLDLIAGERSLQLVLQFLERDSPRRPPSTARHHKAQRPVKHRQFLRRHVSRELLRQPKSGDANRSLLGVLDIVLDLDRLAPHFYQGRQIGIALTNFSRHDRVGVDIDLRES